ncbi:MAG TPA: PilZ domain-containing protein [Kofleriaceae bacterium]|nr:PilZ domain-containing protein [Kofleriaceae bacterium]
MSFPAPTFDLVVALSRLRTREPAAHALAQQVAPGLGATALLGVDVGYRPGTDTALFCLRLDARMITAPLLARTEQGARRAGATVLTLAALAVAERQRLVRLMRRQQVAARGLPDLYAAATFLCDQLGIGGQAGTASPPSLEVRFRRGDTWHPGRLWRLGLDGAFIATGAPPRPGDAVEIELCRPGLNTTLRIPGLCIHTVSPEAARTAGAAGFLARFAFASAADHRALAAALAATPQPATLAAPPRRRDIRYPITWPGRLTAPGRRPIRLLDVSLRGAFIATTGGHLGDRVTVAIPGDNSPSLSLPMRVARVISPAIAGARGLHPGLGLELSAGDPASERAYRKFVARVARRSSLHVILCAHPPRLPELVAEFSAIGYATEGLTRIDDVRQRALAGRGNPDLVILDDSVVHRDRRAAHDLLRVLERRAIAVIRSGHEPPRAARRLADAALVS